MNNALFAALIKNRARARDMCLVACTKNDDPDALRHDVIIATVRSAAVYRDKLQFSVTALALDDDLPIRYIEVTRELKAVIVCGDIVSERRLEAAVCVAPDRVRFEWLPFAHQYLPEHMRLALARVTLRSTPHMLLGQRLSRPEHAQYIATGFAVDRLGTVRVWTTPRVDPDDQTVPLLIAPP